MANILTRFWDWLGDKEHRERFLAIITALTLVGAFVGWVTGLFEPDPGPARPPGDTITVTGGGAVATGSGTAISTGDNSQITINQGGYRR